MPRSNRLTRLLRLLVVLPAAMASVAHGDEKPARVEKLPAPFTAARFKEHVAYLASDELGGRGVGTEGSAKAAAYIIRYFKQFGLKPLAEDKTFFQEFRVKVLGKASSARNILAILPGKGKLAKEAVVVAAHYDHLGRKSPEGTSKGDVIYNGADDNASGVAAMLLVAESLKIADKERPESRRSIIFIAFDAEEQLLLGSVHYLRQPLWPLEKTAAMINFDMVGRLRMRKVYASSAETSPLLSAKVRDAARQVGILAETRFGGGYRGDHAFFRDRGIPAMHILTGIHSDYHKVTDEFDKLNFEGGAIVAWIGSRVIDLAVRHPQRIEFKKLGDAFDIQLALALVRRLGIIPVQNAQAGRYPQILFVIPGSSAAKHGLKSGDQVTAIDGVQFQRVEDALIAFEQLDLANGLNVSILRSGEKSEVKFPPSVFEGLLGPKSTRLKNGKYEVLFTYKGSQKNESVFLAGSFNDWNPKLQKMAGPDKDGNYVTQVELPKGIYEYKFVVDGEDWKTDPKNIRQTGPNKNSVLRVGK